MKHPYKYFVFFAMLALATTALAVSKYKFRVIYINPTQVGIICLDQEDPGLIREGDLLVVQCTERAAKP
jgi:hypothetical protein